MNTLKVVLLLAALSGILLLVGSLVAGRIGLIAALILSTVMNIGGYWYSGPDRPQDVRRQGRDAGRIARSV
jgi:hypothetical protein